MVSGAMTLGQLFKEKRNDLNLTIKEVESSTSIRSTYIEAIEDNRGTELLSSVYMKGFTRQYALFLGLTLNELEEQFGSDLFKEVKQETPKEFSYGLGSIEMRQGTFSSSFWKSTNIVWTIAFIGVFSVAFFLIKLLGIF